MQSDIDAQSTLGLLCSFRLRWVLFVSLRFPTDGRQRTMVLCFSCSLTETIPRFSSVCACLSACFKSKRSFRKERVAREEGGVGRGEGGGGKIRGGGRGGGTGGTGGVG